LVSVPATVRLLPSDVFPVTASVPPTVAFCVMFAVLLMVRLQDVVMVPGVIFHPVLEVESDVI